MYKLKCPDLLKILQDAYGEDTQIVIDESCRDQMDNKDRYIHFTVCFLGMHSEVLARKTDFEYIEDPKKTE